MDPTRAIMVGSSVLLLALGLMLLFLPESAASLLRLPVESAPALSLAAAGPLALAAVNWTGRGAIYGGIYGRPIVLGNFAFGAVATLTALRFQVEHPTVVGWVVTGALGLYWVAFVRLLYRPPFRAPPR